MEMNEKLARELKKKFEMESNKKEAEILEHWRMEIDIIYKKKYESLSSLQVDMKHLVERMSNRINMLMRMVKEGA
jgi:site-specific recombinase